MWALRVAAVTWLLFHGSAFAKPTCSDACPEWVRTENGCCPAQPLKPTSRGTLTVSSNAAGTTVTIGTRRPVRAPVRKRAMAPGVYDLTATAPGYPVWRDVVLVRPGENVTVAITLCAGGRLAAAEGTCCWPAQTVDHQGRCTGKAACPRWLEAADDGCRPSACAAGKERTGVACCWPGQRFDTTFGVCLGAPARCPAGYGPGFGDCVELDQDGDGIKTEADRCPHDAEDRDERDDGDGCPDVDDDEDGVRDTADRCPRVAEDLDGHTDLDGCPDLDDDGDGIADAADRCGIQGEDRDGYEDTDGCPDLDDDKDGLPDTKDSCPRSAEDLDGYLDADGCPDPDNDRDGVRDARDRCGSELETRNGFRDYDGCADSMPSAHAVLAPRRLGVQYGAGVSQSGLAPGSHPSISPMHSSWAVTSSVAVQATRGLELGMIAQCEVDGSSCLTTGFVGIAPLQLASWKNGYGGSRRVWLDPFVQVLATPAFGTMETGLALGTRFAWDDRRGIAVVAGYETSRGVVEGGLRLGVELALVAPRSKRVRQSTRPPLGASVTLGAFVRNGDDPSRPDERGTAALATALITYGGIGVGVTHHGIHGNLMTFEVAAPWHVEPFARMLWYSDDTGPGAIVGARLPFWRSRWRCLVVEAGYELGPGSIRDGFVAGGGLRVEVFP